MAGPPSIIWVSCLTGPPKDKTRIPAHYLPLIKGVDFAMVALLIHLFLVKVQMIHSGGKDNPEGVLFSGYRSFTG